jgi:putative addiction module component (TIGR02574 family)
VGVNPADLAKLSVEEKLDLISELWDNIEASNSAPTLSEAQLAELSRRRSEGLSDPTLMIDWSTVRKKLRRISWPRAGQLPYGR